MYEINTTYAGKEDIKLSKLGELSKNINKNNKFFTIEELLKYLLFKYSDLELYSLCVDVFINGYETFYINIHYMYKKELVKLTLMFRELPEWVYLVFVDKHKSYELLEVFPPFIPSNITNLFVDDIFNNATIQRLKKINFIERPNFGNILIGTWFCKVCDSEWIPKRLEELYEKGYVKFKNNIICPNCGSNMDYDEAE